MSFSDMVSGGAECGPSNPLASLSKRFGHDRGAQLDRYGAGAEASSSATGHMPSFRTQNAATRHAGSDQAFFQQKADPSAFDMAPLNGALPFSPPIGTMDSMNAPHPAAFENSWQHAPNQPREAFSAHFRQPTSSSTNADTGWAREYSPGVDAKMYQQQKSVQQSHRVQQHVPYRPDLGAQGMGRLNMMGVRMGGAGMPSYTSHRLQQQVTQQGQQQSEQADSSQWDSAFTAFDSELESPGCIGSDRAWEKAHVPTEQAINKKAEISRDDADELAKTAGRLVSTVEHDTSSKFKQSNFLNLMRKIRDKQAGIEGTDIVETSAQPSVSTDNAVDKGKGRQNPTTQQEAVQWASQNGLLHGRSSSRPVQLAPGPDSYASEVEGRAMLNDMWAEEDARSEAIERQAMERAFVGDGGNIDQRRREDDEEFAKYQRILGSDMGPAASSLRTSNTMEEDMEDMSAEDFVGRRWQGTRGRGVSGQQGAEWDALQKDWDSWQATSAGMAPAKEAPLSAASAPQYRFHAVNPYITASPDSMSNAVASVPAEMRSVLESEAAVQQDPTNASAWFDLGVKQQENEREGMAIAALHRAIELDPSLRDAWLALAVSYTNENDRTSAFEAIERWIGATPQYDAVVQQHRGQSTEGAARSDTSTTGQGFLEQHGRLTNLLIALARHSSSLPQGEVDADVQVALGVLFNASEDYDKAVDCFQAALSVRPDDWLLYNRLGATLSNSGRSEEALRYYHQALDLRPGFVRCHFNLSISCLNLKLYQDAASHIYTALTLQSESSEVGVDGEQIGDTGGGVTSGSLWETLRVACELMDRPDLAQLTTDRDVNKFDPSDFGLGAAQYAYDDEGASSMPY